MAKGLRPREGKSPYLGRGGAFSFACCWIAVSGEGTLANPLGNVNIRSHFPIFVHRSTAEQGGGAWRPADSFKKTPQGGKMSARPSSRLSEAPRI